jgi:transposase-like protein
MSVSQAARDLDLHDNVLRKWVREQAADPGSAFPGHGVLKPEQQEIERLRRESARIKAERDIQKKQRPTSPGTRYKIRVHREAPGDLAGVADLRSARCFAQRLSRLAGSGAQQARP